MRVRDRDRGAASRVPDVRPKRLGADDRCRHGLARETSSCPHSVVATDAGALIDMAWRKEPAHRLVAVEDVQRLTGLAPREVLLRPDTQHLVRIDGSGKRVEFVRIPIALLTIQPEGMSDLV
jgi:hypothetical protein